MVSFDYTTVFLYILGLFAISWITSKRITDQKDMFSAGRQSPWWVSGLSGFMTMFSASTFVVWGGIAYRLGFVAIMINTCYGIAALAVGFWVAGRWNRLGISTPAEYIKLRYGKVGLHLFTWAMMIKRIMGVSVSLYALALLLVALIPMDGGSFFRDPETGTLSLTWAIVFFGAIVVLYTMQGGLWAVLMTDVLQFIVLTLVVFLVSVLMIFKVDSVSEYMANVPEGFLSPVGGGYGWFFLMGWVLINFFITGAEWAFVQRFIAVRSPKDARKSCYLFGALYLTTPLFWLLPPLLYRGIGPEVNPGQAYILAAQSVLPPGVLGLMFAAMFSATASMVSSQLNVFAGVMTNDFYRPILNPRATQSTLIRVGRVFTVIIGSLLIGSALMVPYMGGAEKLIIAINSLLVVPLYAPAMWGLFSKHIGIRHMLWVSLSSFSLGGLVKFGIIGNPWMMEFDNLVGTIEFLKANSKNVEVSIGVVMPLVMLVVLEWRGRTQDPGWDEVEKQRLSVAQDIEESNISGAFDPMPANIVMVSLLVCSAAMIFLALIADSGRGIIVVFALALLAIAGIIYAGVKRLIRKSLNAESGG